MAEAGLAQRTGWDSRSVRRVAEQVRVGHGGSVRGYQARLEIVPVTKLAGVVLMKLLRFDIDATGRASGLLAGHVVLLRR